VFSLTNLLLLYESMIAACMSLDLMIGQALYNLLALIIVQYYIKLLGDIGMLQLSNCKVSNNCEAIMLQVANKLKISIWR